MSRIVLKYKFSYRLIMAVAAIIMAGFAIWLMSLSLPFLSIFGNDEVGALLGAMVIGMNGLLILVTLYMSYNCLHWWTYQIEFHDNHIEFSGVPMLFMPRAKLPYAQIKQIIGGELRTVLTLLPTTGKPIRIATSNFEGGSSAFVSALTGRLDSDRWDAAEVNAQLRRPTMLDWAYRAGIGLMFAVLIPYSYASFGHRWLVGTVAWQTTYNAGMGNRLLAYDIDSDGAPWVIQDELFSDKQQVIRLGPIPEAFDLPSEEELLDSLASNYSYQPDKLIIDSTGQPWIAYFPHGLLHWTGAKWEWYVLPNGTRDFQIENFLEADAKLWLDGSITVADGYFIIGIDPESKVPTELSLPTDLVDRGRIDELRSGQDGSLIIQVDLGQNAAFFQYRRGQWVAVGVPIIQAEISITDFGADSSGEFWMLTVSRGCEALYSLDRFDVSTSTWVSNDLTSLPACGNNIYYKATVIDPLGRIWFQTSDYTEVLELAPGHIAHPLARYTVDNSNYQDRFADTILALNDQHIWTADEKLVSIDAGVRELPDPLPDWFATAFDSTRRLFWQLSVLPVQAIFLTLNILIRQRITTSKVHRETQLIGGHD
jgi:hypothetical protein